MITPETPNLDKMIKISEDGDNQTIGAFLEWAGDNGYNFTRTVMVTEEREHLWKDETYEVEVPREQMVGIEDVLAEYFGVDRKAAERERAAVFAALQAAREESGA